MTERDFCYWLRGFIEISKVQDNVDVAPLTLNAKQIEMIDKHLDYVFDTTKVKTAPTHTPTITPGAAQHGQFYASLAESMGSGSTPVTSQEMFIC